MITKGMMSSDSNEWYTPQDIYKYLDSIYNFTLDPCAPINENMRINNSSSMKYYTIKNDGLKQSWGGHKVFINPPYGRSLTKWVKKAYEESFKNNALCVMLIPARTDTTYWHDYIFSKAKEIYFIKGRIKFGEIITQEKIVEELKKEENSKNASKKYKSKINYDDLGKLKFINSAPFPSAIVVFGYSKEDFAFNDLDQLISTIEF